VLAPVALGLACVATAGWVAVTRWSTLVAGHPAYPVLLVAVVLVGVALLVTTRRVRRGGALQSVGRVAGAVVLVAVLAAVIWLRP
jgi:hypothetical protein